MKKPDIHFMGTRIKEFRQGKGLKAYEFAKVIKISQGSMSDIENNKSLPSAETLHNLKVYTNVDIIWILTGDHEGDTPENAHQSCHGCRKITHVLDLVKKALEK